jgi:hypothetical protein
MSELRTQSVALEYGPIWTPEIGRFLGTVVEWVSKAYPGGYVRGVQRVGKSQAVLYANATLETDFLPDTVVFTAGASKSPKTRNCSEAALLLSALQRAGHPALHGPIHLLRTRLVSTGLDRVRKKSAGTIVFIVDEAQLLQVDGAYAVMAVVNEWEAHGLQVCVILVGQPELHLQHKEYLEMKQYHILGRFFCHDFHFKGIAEKELPEVLRCMDEAKSNDQPSSSFIGRYRPNIVKKGFRIAPSADSLLSALQELKERAHLSKNKLSIPMQYLASAAIAIALNAERSLRCDYLATPKEWVQALHSANFGAVLQGYVNLNRRSKRT